MFGMALAIGLVLGVVGCSGDDTSPQSADTPSAATSSTPVTPSATQSQDASSAAKVKALADYKYFVAVWTKGRTSGNPAYPYDQVMTGKALQMTKSVATADDLRGIKATGTVTFLRGSVVALDLKAKPATATVRSCELDRMSGVDKKGTQVYRPGGEVSTETTMALVGNRWKVSNKAVSGKDEGACAD